MEQEEYRARAMFRADRKAEMECAISEGIAEGVAIGKEETRTEILSLIRSGYSLADIEKRLS